MFAEISKSCVSTMDEAGWEGSFFTFPWNHVWKKQNFGVMNWQCGKKIKITVTSACYAFVTLHQVLYAPTLSYKFSGLIIANIVEQSQPSIS